MLLLIFYPNHPPPPPTGTVATMEAADPVDFKEMAAEQNRCSETQCLLGGIFLKLAFRQTGAQRLAGDIPPALFAQLFPSISEKIFSPIFITLLTPGACLPSYYFIQVCVARNFQRRHRLGPRVSGLPAGQDPPPHTPGPQPIPIPQRRFYQMFFSPSC
jgi:hypothetical protein